MTDRIYGEDYSRLARLSDKEVRASLAQRPISPTLRPVERTSFEFVASNGRASSIGDIVKRGHEPKATRTSRSYRSLPIDPERVPSLGDSLCDKIGIMDQHDCGASATADDGDNVVEIIVSENSRKRAYPFDADGKESSSSGTEGINGGIVPDPNALGFEENDGARLDANSTSFFNNPVLAMISKIMVPRAKRKIQSFNIDLCRFCVMINAIYWDTTISEKSDGTVNASIPNDINSYVTRTVSGQLLNGGSRVKTGNEEDEATKLTRDKHKCSIFMSIINECFCALEKANISTSFPREAFKFFLATHSSAVTPNDFITGNFNGVSARHEKKNDSSKTQNQLPPGGILLEYVKGLDAFVSNIGRATKEDTDALRYIIENDMRLSTRIYSQFIDTRFADARYETDTGNVEREGFVRIACNNFKRAAILLTRNIVMQHDGHEFVVPSINVEKDIPVTQLSRLKPGEYVVLDVLLCAKNRILDLLAANMANEHEVTGDYARRLQFVTERFPELKCVTFITNEVSVLQDAKTSDVSCVRKPVLGKPNDVSYVYTKPPLTVAIVGRYEKHVCLAFKQDNDTLVTRIKSNVSGPLVPLILLREFQRVPHNSERAEIQVNGQAFEITGELFGVRLFKNAILAELRESNKLGALSEHDVSRITDYRPPVTQKDDQGIEYVETLLNKNVSRLADIITRQSNGPKLLKLLNEKYNVDIPIKFDGLDN